MNNRKSGVKIPPFLSKLYEINEEYEDIVTWNEEGNAFIILDFSIFCDQILPKYFKHSNFASFVRQLNMYDFHKTKHGTAEQAFQHHNFRKDNYDLLSQIKRKNYNEATKKGVNTRKKKVDFETIKSESINISGILEDLKKRVDTLEGKHSYLEICHSELAQRYQKIKMQLSNLMEKEKQLEGLLIFALKNFPPNFFIKNSDLKYFGNFLPEGDLGSTGNNNQLIELNKSTYQKNDVLNKIFKEIKNLIQYYYLVNNTESNAANNSSSQEAMKIKKDDVVVMDDKNEKKTNTGSNVANISSNPENEHNLRYREFQKRFYNYFDEVGGNLGNSAGTGSNITKIIPRRTSGVQIIENNAENAEELLQPNSSLFEIVPDKNQTNNANSSNIVPVGNFLNTKRKRSRLMMEDFAYDNVHPGSNYKLEKKE